MSGSPRPPERWEYYHFPDAERLPLIVGARMSLSFPLLISGVPLWTRDFTLLEEAERNKLRRCLFSDGGLSSNFPIHFFDRLMPNSPTFAISLDEFDKWAKSRPCVAAVERRKRNSVAGSAHRRPRRLPDAAADVGQGLAGQSSKHPSGISGADRACRARTGGGRDGSSRWTKRPSARSSATASKPGRRCAINSTSTPTGGGDFWSRWPGWRKRSTTKPATGDQGVPGGPEGFSQFLDRYSANPASYKQALTMLPEMLKRGAELAASGADWRAEPGSATAKYQGR